MIEQKLDDEYILLVSQSVIIDDDIKNPILFMRNSELFILDINQFIYNTALYKNRDGITPCVYIPGCANIYGFLGDMTDEVVNNCNATLRRNGIRKKMSLWSENDIIIKLNKYNDEYYIGYYITKRDDISSNSDNFIRNIMRLKLNDKITKYTSDIAESVVLKGERNKMDLSDLTKVNLYDYQLNDIEWLEGKRREIDSGNNVIKYKINVFEHMDGIYSDGIGCSRVKPFRLHYDQDLTYKGANLINEMGLGKTLTMLSFILKDKNPYDKYIKEGTSEFCNYYYKKGKSRGQHCSKKRKDDLYCNEHKNTPFIDKTRAERQYLNEFNMMDIYKSHASLIICPVHLCDQWVREYYDKINKKCRVLLVVNYYQYVNLDFADVLFADIIIISYDFIKRADHPHTVSDPTLSSKNVNIFDFRFKSIVLDEFHEIDDEDMTYISKLQSLYTWNLSGTPFARGLDNTLNGLEMISDMEFETPVNKWSLRSYINNRVSEDLIFKIKQLYRLNTRESIKDEIKQSCITTTIKELEFTDIERSIYDSFLSNSKKVYKTLVRLCCDPEMMPGTSNLIKRCHNLKDIRDAILSHHKGVLDSLKLNINMQENIIRSHGITDLSISDIALLKQYRRNLTCLIKEKNDTQRMYDYLVNSINELEDTVEVCLICMDEMTELSITSCGHKYCTECINNYISVYKKHNCPKCKTYIDNSNIFMYKDDAKEGKQSDLYKLIEETKSTKLANIIHYVMEKPDVKIIIFSQWDMLLKKIDNKLRDLSIKTALIKGSVYQKNNAIKSFTKKNSDVNVILLSSDSAASGLNLTIATEIILVEPIYGSADYKKDIESQSIGRSNRINQTKPINIVKFIMKDTVEEELELNEIMEI